jgi:hypothetical protein
LIFSHLLGFWTLQLENKLDVYLIIEEQIGVAVRFNIKSSISGSGYTPASGSAL